MTPDERIAVLEERTESQGEILRLLSSTLVTIQSDVSWTKATLEAHVKAVADAPAQLRSGNGGASRMWGIAGVMALVAVGSLMFSIGMAVG